MKRALAIILLLGALAAVITACQMPVPPRPPSGPTATSIFAEYTPQPSVESPTAEAPTPEEPTAEAPTKEAPTEPAPTAVAPTTEATAAPTEPAATAAPATTEAPVTTAAPAATSAPTPAAGVPLPSASLALPAKYILQRGEFPYCIARRYNVNPYELMSLNGFSFHQLFYAGQVVWLPQTGNPWPVERALHSHTTTYTVKNNRENFYSVACYFGDIDPAALARANGMDVNARLTKGLVLTLVP